MKDIKYRPSCPSVSSERSSTSEVLSVYIYYKDETLFTHAERPYSEWQIRRALYTYLNVLIELLTNTNVGQKTERAESRMTR